MALTLTQVQSLFGVAAGGALGGNLAGGALGGNLAGGAPAGNAATAIPALRRATADGAEAKGIAREKRDPVTLTALAQFRVALDKAPTIEAALQDPRILKVLMPALGLPDQAGNPGLVRRALLSDPADANGLAARLGATWRAAAATLGVYETGLAGLRDAAMVQRLSDGYLKYQYRTGLDEQQAGMSDALYFLERAKTADDVFDLLGDPVLRRVVTGALALPDQIAVQSVEAQGRAVAARLSVASLQDAGAVRKLAERYVVAAANRAGEAAGAAPSDPFALIARLSVRA